MYKRQGVHKPGADFPLQDEMESVNVFRFDRALDPQFPYAYQVKREEFDHLLFRNAMDNGVDAVSYTHLDVYKRQPVTRTS